MGPQATFFTIDPDVPYFGNSLLYIVSKSIGFNVHPGTPTIILTSLALMPLRLFVHFVIETPFVSWVFNNLFFTVHYIRYFQTLLLSLSVGIFLLAIYNSTNSKLMLIISWLSIFTFSSFSYFGVTIVPETLSFFFISLWLLAFSYFAKSKSPLVFILMSLIAGVAVGNKFTNVPLAFITFLLTVTIPNLSLKQKALNLSLSIFVFIIMFLISTWPIRHTYPGMFAWITRLASTTGVQGSGKKAIFDFASYSLSVRTLINRERIPFYIVIVTFLSVLYNQKIKKNRFITPLNIMVVGVFFSLIVFSKYNLSYYQLANYAIVIYIAAVILNSLPKTLKISLVVLLLFPVIANISSFYTSISTSSQKTIVLEEFVKSNPPERGTVWSWGRSSDFSILWIRDWTGGRIFGDNIADKKGNLYELNTNFEYVTTPDNNIEELFSACWDKLYLLESSLESFLLKYPQYNSSYILISGTDDMALVTSTHCLSKD